MSGVARVSFCAIGALILIGTALSAKAEPGAAHLVDALNSVFGEHPHTRRVTPKVFA